MAIPMAKARRAAWRLVPVGALVVTAASLIAGRGEGAFRFPHPPHRDVECGACHGAAVESEVGTDILLPENTVCVECHEQTDVDAWGYVKPQVLTSGFPNFSHEQHLVMEGMGDCLFCHGALVDPALQGTGRGEPGHPVCFTCHDGEQATNECRQCHARVEDLRPVDHDIDFLHTHQFQARGFGGTCETCHRQSEQCSECHQGDNVLFRTHPRDYVFTHPLDARKNEHDCLSCHDTQTFCSDCHAESGVRPSNHDAPDWVRFAGGPNLHGVEARRDIAYCAGCHEAEGGDPLCSRCHRDSQLGRGNDRNIHAGGFEDIGVEGPWHDDDGYYCYDCHTRSSQPEGFCGYCHGIRGDGD